MTHSNYLDEALRRIKTGVFVSYKPEEEYNYAVVNDYGICYLTNNKNSAFRHYLLLTAA